ncbi:hypothetical protein Slin_2678 [Spirosoma linguale DSM 74]|uniref:Uncharacterized protein n=1 Tax=Spirosoma linguale (strain ATCC 33905 / DSM 74 / LMG 10896 / Claus 1) TaxID=504472 RepID=D2QIB0_SPILD|nr:hypothetical protein Slin_2678 [Spirosoma linguale DSM 74]
MQRIKITILITWARLDHILTNVYLSTDLGNRPDDKKNKQKAGSYIISEHPAHQFCR